MHGLADTRLVAVAGGGVDVAVAGEQRAGRDVRGVLGRDLEDAEPELRDLDFAAQMDARDRVCFGHSQTLVAGVRLPRHIAEGSCSMAAHVMVLANRTAAAPELIGALLHRAERGPIAVTLVMPAPASPERLDACSGGVARGGDRAVRRGSSRRRARSRRSPRSGIRCATTRSSCAPCPGESSRWIRSDLPHSVARYTGVLGAARRCAPDPAAAHAPSPAPVHEKRGAGAAERPLVGRPSLSRRLLEEPLRSLLVLRIDVVVAPGAAEAQRARGPR